MAGRKNVNGGPIPNTPLSVDFFKRSELPARMLFFLTHAHADHLHGLDSSFDQKIYCTPMTKKLLLLLVSLNPDQIIEVQYDEPFQIYLSCPEQVTICVTAIDAYHCPGAAMFIFEGYFGKILYTGDFRFACGHVSNEILLSCQPDLLYLDNTYNNSVCVFPSREEMQERIVQMVSSSPDRVFIAMNRVGKEELLAAIAKHTSLKIGVSEEQYGKMCALGFEEICSLDTDNCKVTVVPFYSIKTKNVDRWVSEMPTQIIVPTARFVGRDCTLPNYSFVKVIPHSDHSSYDELLEFVKLVKPVAIQPIVHIKDCLNMSRFDPFLTDRPQIQYDVPQSVALDFNVSFSKRFPGKPRPLLTTSPSVRLLRKRKGIQYLSPVKKSPLKTNNRGSPKQVTEKHGNNPSPEPQTSNWKDQIAVVDHNSPLTSPKLSPVTSSLSKKIDMATSCPVVLVTDFYKNAAKTKIHNNVGKHKSSPHGKGTVSSAKKIVSCNSEESPLIIGSSSSTTCTDLPSSMKDGGSELPLEAGTTVCNNVEDSEQSKSAMDDGCIAIPTGHERQSKKKKKTRKRTQQFTSDLPCLQRIDTTGYSEETKEIFDLIYEETEGLAKEIASWTIDHEEYFNGYQLLFSS